MLDYLTPKNAASRTKWSRMSGLEAAEAILSGDRGQFDRHIAPETLALKGATKTFEFRVPDR